jgi:hypothetical protein
LKRQGLWLCVRRSLRLLVCTRPCTFLAHPTVCRARTEGSEVLPLLRLWHELCLSRCPAVRQHVNAAEQSSTEERPAEAAFDDQLFLGDSYGPHSVRVRVPHVLGQRSGFIQRGRLLLDFLPMHSDFFEQVRWSILKPVRPIRWPGDPHWRGAQKLSGRLLQ